MEENGVVLSNISFFIVTIAGGRILLQAEALVDEIDLTPDVIIITNTPLPKKIMLSLLQYKQ